MSLPRAGSRRGPNAFQVVVAAFAAFTAGGTALLSLPGTHVASHGGAHRLVDDFFMAASAISVTGLACVDPATAYTPLGQAILLLLVQVGGLGYMTLFTLAMLLVGRRLSMRDRLALQTTEGMHGLGGLVAHVRRIVGFTLATEAIGLALLAACWIPEFGPSQGLWLATFHAVSAFNHAGLSLLPGGMMAVQAHVPVLLVLAALTIVPSLGFPVIHEIRCRLRPHTNVVSPTWSPLARIVLGLTAVLLVGGTAAFWLLEHANPKTLGPMSPGLQAVNAFFMAVQPRSSGFNSVDPAALTAPTVMLTIFLMFVGGGPGGTAGGIKLTTFAIILAAVWSTLRGDADVNLPGLRRRVDERLVRKAFAVFALSVGFVMGMSALIDAIEPHAFLPVFFEVVSAFSTTGMSLGITGQLGPAGKVLLALTMLIGRVGLLSVLLSVFTVRRPSAVRYGEEPLMIG